MFQRECFSKPTAAQLFFSTVRCVRPSVTVQSVFIYSPLMTIQTRMTVFLQWKTKEDVFIVVMRLLSSKNDENSSMKVVHMTHALYFESPEVMRLLCLKNRVKFKCYSLKFFTLSQFKYVVLDLTSMERINDFK